MSSIMVRSYARRGAHLSSEVLVGAVQGQVPRHRLLRDGDAQEQQRLVPPRHAVLRQTPPPLTASQHLLRTP